MKKGINYWALPADANMQSKFSIARKHGFDGLELVIMNDGGLSRDSSEKELAEIRHIADSEGVEIPSITDSQNWACSLTSNSKAVRQLATDELKREIDIAASLNVPAVLALPGFVRFDHNVNGLHPSTDTQLPESYSPASEIVRYDFAYERAAEGLYRVSSYAEEASVCICVENIWSDFLLSPLEMRSLIDSVGSPMVKCYFDAGNVNPFGIPEHWIEILGDRIARIHIKDYKKGALSLDGFVNLGDGDLDFSLIASALKRIGYDGWITAEVNADPFLPEHAVATASKVMDKFFDFEGGK